MLLFSVHLRTASSIYFASFSYGNNFCDFQFAFLVEEILQKMGILLKKRICSYRSKFIPLRADPYLEGDKGENRRVAYPESVPIHLNTYTSFFWMSSLQENAHLRITSRVLLLA